MPARPGNDGPEGKPRLGAPATSGHGKKFWLDLRLTAEAVEKGIPRGYFLPIFISFGPAKIIYNQL